MEKKIQNNKIIFAQFIKLLNFSLLDHKFRILIQLFSCM